LDFGLSGAGKSTVAKALDAALYAQGRHTYVLDGDNLRNGLNSDLGFTREARTENIRRVAEVAKLMGVAGLIAIVAAISPSQADREHARSIVGSDRFMDVFADAPLSVCEARDVKGLYAKARKGAIKNFTGVSSAFEAPVKTDIHLKTATDTVASEVERISFELRKRAVF
jgi:adenylyl-sulfate kinase